MTELYIEQERPTRNRVTGRFLKGHTPHNKGKKWEDYLDKRKWNKIKRIGLKNLKPSANTSAGWNAKRVVAIKDAKLVCVYPSMREAENRTGFHQKKIKRCCIGKRRILTVINGSLRTILVGAN